MRYLASVKAIAACVAVTWLLIGVDSAAAQTTAPATGGHQRVLVYPFSQVSTPGKLDWLSHGIQEDLLTELNSSRGMQAMAPAAGQEAAPADVAAAIDQGRRAGVSYVVFGHFQASDTELRISGHVVDVQDPQNGVTRLKVTGPVRTLFSLEDALDSQVESAVGLAAPAAPQANSPPPSYQAPSYQAPSYQPQSAAPPSYQPPQSSSEDYIGPYDSPPGSYMDQGPYYNDYPSYDYGYGYAPYYYGGFPYSFGFGFGGRAFRGGGSRGGFSRGGFHGSAGGGFHGGGGSRGGGGGHR